MYMLSNGPLDTTYTHDFKSLAGGRYKFMEGKKQLTMSNAGIMFKPLTHRADPTNSIPHREYLFDRRSKNSGKDKKYRRLNPCVCQFPQLGKHDQMYKAFMKDCKDPAWNSVAPYGCLIEPHLQPTKIRKAQKARLAEDFPPSCFRTQPNRFLNILDFTYPELYKDIKHASPDVVYCKNAGLFLGSTYQYDFCNVREFPGGIYKSLTEMDEERKMTARLLLHKEPPCFQFRKIAKLKRHNFCADEAFTLCDDGNEFEPFKIDFRDKDRFGYSGNEGHWRSQGNYTKQANWAEYHGAIKRFGCVPPRHSKNKCGANADKDCAHFYTNLCGNWRPLGNLGRI